jgi:RNA polymerase sigma-70 factor (ECF subfamily)
VSSIFIDRRARAGDTIRRWNDAFESKPRSSMTTPDQSTEEQHLMELMVAYQRGDRAAVERLYTLLCNEVRSYFAGACRDRRATDDLVQDTFLEMHRSRQTYNPPLPVRPWLFGIARNVLARARRVAKHQDVNSSGDLEAESVPGTPCVPSIDAVDLENAISRLPNTTRDPWLLHHVFGFSFHSIAARLGITVMAAKLRSSRASRALRTALSTDPERQR